MLLLKEETFKLNMPFTTCSTMYGIISVHRDPVQAVKWFKESRQIRQCEWH